MTPEEVLNTIHSLKNNKAPGDDGFGAEFYKAFPSLVVQPLTNVFNAILTSSTFPPSWNAAVITVIPKKGRDILNPKSYHLISLLNQDCKIFTALLAQRLNKIIGNYVSPDQTGFIPSRDIVDNVFKALDIIHYCTTRSEDPALILALDIEKAFDSVESTYLSCLLSHMYFGPRFRTAVDAIYKEPSARVQVNGQLSTPFPITRGTRQGCPLSPLLFALAMEPLAESLHNSEGYTGVNIGKKQYKLSLFADDMALFISDPFNSLPATEQLLDRFQSVSGLCVNKEKSLIYPMKVTGGLRSTMKRRFPYTWAVDSWRYLGVTIPVNFSTFTQQNLESVNEEVKTMLKTWTEKHLSWFECITLIKSMIFLKYLFLFRAVPIGITSSMLHLWQRTLLNFVWGYKKPRLSLQLLLAKRSKGGQALPHLSYYYEAAVLATLLKHYNPNYIPDWKDIEDDAFQHESF